MNVLGVLWYMVCMFVNPLSVYFYQGTAQKADGKEGEKSPENAATVKTKETNVEHKTDASNNAKPENEIKDEQKANDTNVAQSSSEQKSDNVEPVSSSVLNEKEAGKVEKSEEKSAEVKVEQETNEQPSQNETEKCETSDNITDRNPPLACQDEEGLDTPEINEKNAQESDEVAKEPTVESVDDAAAVVEKQPKEPASDNSQDTPKETDVKSEESSKPVAQDEETVKKTEELIEEPAKEIAEEQSVETATEENSEETQQTEEHVNKANDVSEEAKTPQEQQPEAGEEEKDEGKNENREESKQSEEPADEANIASEEATGAQEQQSKTVEEEKDEGDNEKTPEESEIGKQTLPSMETEQQKEEVVDNNVEVSKSQ